MPDDGERRYAGTGTRLCDPLAEAWTQREPYIASTTLTEAVNVAMYLGRPLLLEGEPGCGKTRLAYAVAYELGYPLKACYIRSEMHAQDLLYSYDAVRRLYDLQELAVRKDNATLPSRRTYVTLGRLGQAIALSEKDIPSVVLIDEIDKADIDFPNDLLLVLDRLQFEISEAEGRPSVDALRGQARSARRPYLPLIIVTSNREKELPQPFLRRCLFYYIDFPTREELANIVAQHFERAIDGLFEVALLQFWALREEPNIKWRRLPATSELLDWVRILEHEEERGRLTAGRLAATAISKLPHMEALIKTRADWEAVTRLTTDHE